MRGQRLSFFASFFASCALLLAPFFYAHSAHAYSEPVWSKHEKIPLEGRANPYQVPETEYEAVREKGLLHTLSYPVEITGSLIPYRSLENLFSYTFGLVKIDALYKWLGLFDYPDENLNAKLVTKIPYPDGNKPETPMGATFFNTAHGKALTLSCTICHTSQLFGKPILGLTNRFPRANRFFEMGRKASLALSPETFRRMTNATPGEDALFRRLRENVRFIGVKTPQALGLDTSLSQVALSLAKRAPDSVATKDPYWADHPRPDLLDHFSADSKPGVWWNLKYKNRFLLDGSVISGNPIYTNILWNEIGRGTDLVNLEKWLDQNQKTIEELTTAVFSIEAPRVTDFFEVKRISLEKAQRGKRYYDASCAKCHGTYEKAWEGDDSDSLPLIEKLKTVRVLYHEKTPVIDVGTDPNRYLGMTSLAKRLNPLSISIKNKIVIEPGKGYVPPPLVGIWSRYPYFHNNSIPNLCALLTRSEDRPKVYYSGQASSPSRDYDFECMGYPTGSKTPRNWYKRSHRFDTKSAGLHNFGHDEGIFLDRGREIYSDEEKSELREFLKTL